MLLSANCQIVWRISLAMAGRLETEDSRVETEDWAWKRLQQLNYSAALVAHNLSAEEIGPVAKESV